VATVVWASLHRHCTVTKGWNRSVFRRDRKTTVEGAEVTCSGRLFQIRAVTGEARSPTVDSRVRLTISDEDELERSPWQALTSATWQSSSVRYEDADPWRHLYTQVADVEACQPHSTVYRWQLLTANCQYREREWERERERERERELLLLLLMMMFYSCMLCWWRTHASGIHCVFCVVHMMVVYTHVFCVDVAGAAYRRVDEDAAWNAHHRSYTGTDVSLLHLLLRPNLQMFVGRSSENPRIKSSLWFYLKRS